MDLLSGVHAGAVVGFAAAAAVWDLRVRRVPNTVVLAGLAAAFLLAAARGWPGLLSALTGVAVLGVPFILFWLAGMVGAGDAKVAMAVGALLGMPDALSGLLWGALAGGALVIGVLGVSCARSSGGMVRALRTGGLTGATAALASDPAWGASIPYAAALGAGSVWALIQMGGRL